MKQLVKTLATSRAARDSMKAREQELVEQLMDDPIYREYTDTILERRAVDKEIRQLEVEVRRIAHQTHSAGEELPEGLNTREFYALRVVNEAKLKEWVLQINPNFLTLDEKNVIGLLRLMPQPELAVAVLDVQITIATKLAEMYAEKSDDSDSD